MENILKQIKAINILSEKGIEKFLGLLTEVKLPKGHILIEAGKIDQQLYLIEQGIVRAFSVTDTHELTFWFGKEGDAVFSYNSYVKNQPGYESVELLENAVLYKISLPDLQQLYHTDIEFANWGRRLIENEIVQLEERFISRQVKTASERYKELLHHSPDLLQRVQLSFLASYLGITPVSLSRIRAEIR
jgi:CRP-like cAMP-binding protein